MLHLIAFGTLQHYLDIVMINATTKISSIIINYPQTIAIFESYGIDYKTGGNRYLDEVCEIRNLELELVLEVLTQVKNY